MKLWWARSALHRATRGLCTVPGSFVTRARTANDCSVLLGPFGSAGRFDACLERAGMTCLAIGDGQVACSLTVNEELSNNYGTLHGGATSTIVDIVGTMALLATDPTRAGVSIALLTVRSAQKSLIC